MRHSARSLLVSAAPTSLPFLFSFRLTLVLSSPSCSLLRLSFYLNLWQIWQELCSLSCSIRLQWVLEHTILPGNDAADELARRGALPRPLLSLVVSLLLSLVSTLVYSRTEGVLSHRNSLNHKFPRYLQRNLYSLVMLAVSSLVYAATDTAFFWVLISLGLAESRILPASPVDTRPRTPLISWCSVQLRNLCAARSFRSLCLSTTSGAGTGSCPASGAQWSSAMPPSIGRVG